MKPPTRQSDTRPVPDIKKLLRENLRIARKNSFFASRSIDLLAAITKEFGFSLNGGELQIIDGSWYVTHTGLLRLARRKRCRGIHVEAVDSLCDSAANRFVLKATVFPSKSSSGFVGYGDADPSNVSSLVRGAEMRIAETRAVNRALRKAYGIGICSVEEIGTIPTIRLEPSSHRRTANGNGQWNWPQGSRPALPDHPPAQARPRTGQGLRRRLLRHQDAPRRQQGTGRELRPAAGRAGRRRTAMPCSASSTAMHAQSRRWSHETPIPRTF